MVPLPRGTFGAAWQAGIRGLSSGSLGINQVALDYGEWTLPNGVQSAFLHHVRYNDSSSTDLYGIRLDGAELLLDTVNSYNPYPAPNGGVHSELHQSRMASGLGIYKHLVIELAKV